MSNFSNDVHYAQLMKNQSDNSRKLPISTGEYSASSAKMLLADKLLSCESPESKEQSDSNATEQGYEADNEFDPADFVDCRKKINKRNNKPYCALPPQASSSDLEMDVVVGRRRLTSDASSDLTSDSSDGTLDLMEREYNGNELLPYSPETTSDDDLENEHDENSALFNV